MLRGLIGYLLGFTCCFLIIGTFIGGNPIDIGVSIVLSIMALIVLLVWCYKHHKKKQKEYYDRFKN